MKKRVKRSFNISMEEKTVWCNVYATEKLNLLKPDEKQRVSFLSLSVNTTVHNLTTKAKTH